jgi:hypothetical protein
VWVSDDELGRINSFVTKLFQELLIFRSNDAYLKQDREDYTIPAPILFKDSILFEVPPAATTVLLQYEAAIATAASVRPWITTAFRRMGVAIAVYSPSLYRAGMIHLGSQNLDKKHQRKVFFHNTDRSVSLMTHM